MFNPGQGWVSLRDETGHKIDFDNPYSAQEAADKISESPIVIDAMPVAVETVQVYCPITRKPMTLTTYTGMRNTLV